MEQVKGLTKRERDQIRKRIKAKGMTLTGWSRVNKFSYKTVNNVINSDYGKGKLTPMAAAIIQKLREV